MKTFTLFWLTGDSELVTGNTPEQAMTLAGYSNGAVKALDFYAPGDMRNCYYWDNAKRTWIHHLDKSPVKSNEV
jgi:hypothetical protein